MKYKLLGNTGLRVSELCLGTMTFGGSEGIWKAIGGMTQQESTAMTARALDAGINFFDTANGYGGGDSEVMLGKALGPRRKDVIIATKVGFPTGTGPNDKGLTRAHILRAVEDSLRRLGTDYIDVYIAHRRDAATPPEETMAAFDDLVRSGKVRYLGISNFPAWGIVKANAIAEARHASRFECLQAYYNIAARDIEREITPMLLAERVGLMVWSPLAGGVLAGKYSETGKAPADARRASFDLGPVDYPRVKRILDIARPIAERQRGTLAQVTLAWLLRQEAVTTVVLGAKRMSQFEDNLGCLDIELSADDMRALDAASELPVEYPGWFTKLFDGM